jgi:hypothetical protein
MRNLVTELLKFFGRHVKGRRYEHSLTTSPSGRTYETHRRQVKGEVGIEVEGKVEVEVQVDAQG